MVCVRFIYYDNVEIALHLIQVYVKKPARLDLANSDHFYIDRVQILFQILFYLTIRPNKPTCTFKLRPQRHFEPCVRFRKTFILFVNLDKSVKLKLEIRKRHHFFAFDVYSSSV